MIVNWFMDGRTYIINMDVLSKDIFFNKIREMQEIYSESKIKKEINGQCNIDVIYIENNNEIKKTFTNKANYKAFLFDYICMKLN